MSLIYFGGINGVGKTAIVEELSRQLPELKIFHGSTELMKALGVSTADYDSLRKISEEVKSQAVEKIFCRLAIESQNRDIIIVAHYVKILNGAITPSNGSWYRHCQKLILVVSPPEEILGRISSDERSGQRMNRSLFGQHSSLAQEKIKFLEAAQYMSEQVMNGASEYFNIQSYYIENLNGKKATTISQLIRILQGR